jgi:uncharacterized membrane protein YvlD (DUF360 family)
MKRIIRHYIIDTASLFFVSRIASGFIFERGIETLLLAGIALTAASLLAKPIINFLLLPINLVTFNLFRWLSSTVALYLVTLVVPGFKVAGFFYPGLTSKWLDIPTLNFEGVMALIAFSFILSIITSIIYWIIS